MRASARYHATPGSEAQTTRPALDFRRQPRRESQARRNHALEILPVVAPASLTLEPLTTGYCP